MPRLLKIIRAFACFMLFGLLAACNRPDSDSALPPANMQRLFQVQGQIQQGPDAGLTLNGDLRITLEATGRLQGTLIRETGSPITVTGQIAGQAIHLAFDLGNNAAVLGVGTLQYDISNPQGTAGGLLTGPQPGDSGDWFGRWTIIVTPATPSPIQPVPNDNNASSTNNLILMLGIIIAMLLAGALLRQPVAGKSLYTKTRGRSTVPFLKGSAQTVEPERWPEETALPLAQFATTYAHGDDHYDLSFTIESARGEFLGDCGVGISATTAGSKLGTDSEVTLEVSKKMPSADDALTFLTKLAAGKEDQLSTRAEQEADTRLDEIMGRKPTKAHKAKAAVRVESLATTTADGKHKAVTALEVWVFDKNDINTVTKVLRSAHGLYHPAQRHSRDPVSDVLAIEPDQLVILETKTLRLRVKVLAVDYLEDLASPQSFFKQVNLKLAVWQR